jgi:hypothetical protein
MALRLSLRAFDLGSLTVDQLRDVRKTCFEVDALSLFVPSMNACIYQQRIPTLYNQTSTPTHARRYGDAGSRPGERRMSCWRA